MKKINLMIISVFTLLTAGNLKAQTIYDANRLIGGDLNGTARFVGMGGAMGALGGDISTMGTNPAGIGIYRSNDMMFSLGFNNTSAKSNSSGTEMNTDKFFGSFDNIGFVYSNKIGNQTALKYVNFGFNYHRMKSFDKNMVMSGDLNDVSQTDQFALQARGLNSTNMESQNVFFDNGIGWLSALAWNGHLIDPVSGQIDEYQGLMHGYPYGDFSSRERGGIQAYDFNVSFNIQDRVYLGATVGAYSVDYSKYTSYTESYEDDASNYTLENWFKTTGSGIDFKIGAIVRPFAASPLRLGVAVNTPVFYNLTDKSSAILNSNIDVNYDNVISESENKYIDTYEEAGDTKTDYRLTTPWKYNFSLGYTVGSNLALGAEYEYSDYSTSKLKYDDGVSMSDENYMIKQSLKGVSTFRLGAEYKVIPEFSIRGGYNHITASMDNGSYKSLPLRSIRTDTEYTNAKAINNYTLGMGYRGETFYADIAYQYSAYDEDFYLFDDETMNLPATKVSNSKSAVVFTLGMRF